MLSVSPAGPGGTLARLPGAHGVWARGGRAGVPLRAPSAVVSPKAGAGAVRICRAGPGPAGEERSSSPAPRSG